MLVADDSEKAYETMCGRFFQHLSYRAHLCPWNQAPREKPSHLLYPWICRREDLRRSCGRATWQLPLFRAELSDKAERTPARTEAARVPYVESRASRVFAESHSVTAAPRSLSSFDFLKFVSEESVNTEDAVRIPALIDAL